MRWVHWLDSTVNGIQLHLVSLTLSGREVMFIKVDLSFGEKVTKPETGETSSAGSAPLLEVTFQKTETLPKVPFSRKTSKLALSVLSLDSPMMTTLMLV